MGHRGGDACGIARVDRDGSATFAYATARSLPSRDVLGIGPSELTAGLARTRAGCESGASRGHRLPSSDILRVTAPPHSLLVARLSSLLVRWLQSCLPCFQSRAIPSSARREPVCGRHSPLPSHNTRLCRDYSPRSRSSNKRTESCSTRRSLALRQEPSLGGQ
jgi:hypothetical protein